MKRLLPRLAIFVWLSLFSARAAVLLNEININPAGGDDAAWQYVEILTINADGQPESQTLGDISILFVDSNGDQVGIVEEALHLEGLSTGTNGLLLIGIGFDRHADVPWEVLAATAVADFNAIKGVGGTGDIDPKGGLSVLLVENFTGRPQDDLDGLNTGEIGRDDLIGRVLDSVGYGDLIAYETRLTVDFSPDNLSRVAGMNRANVQSPWIGGEFQDTDKGPLEVRFVETFGDFTGLATPGHPNPAPPSLTPIRINEVLINPPGNDDNVEFIELISMGEGATPRGFTTTNNLWILIVESDAEAAESGNERGEILDAWDLNGRSTGSNGLLVLGNNYRPSSNPWKDVISKETELFDPEGNDLTGASGMGSEDIGQGGSISESNRAISILLVQNFVGTAKSGATAGTDLDTDDDGLIDQRPWDTSTGSQGILDSIGFDHLNGVTGELRWETYAVADVTQTGNLALTEPDSLVRHPNRMEANDASAWMGGSIGGTSTTGIAYRPSANFGDFRTQISPGQPNPDSAPDQALILLNEVHLNPPGADDASPTEFIEFLSPSRTFSAFQDLTLLVVDLEGLNKGEITNRIVMNGLSTGGTGLLAIGDSFDDSTPYDTKINISPSVHLEDPDGYTKGDFGPNENVAILLVQGFTGQQTDDLDTDDDGIFDVHPWELVMDSVGLGDGLGEQENLANFNAVGITPDSLCRIPGDFRQNAVDAWYGGTLVGPELTSLVYEKSFGPFVGEATPGQLNLAGPRHASAILINEVHVNPPGNDDNFEYVELISPTGGRQSTNDLSLVVLESAGNNVGDILEVWALDGMSTGTNGILLLGNDYPLLVSGQVFRDAYWDRSLFPQFSPNTPFDNFKVDNQLTAVGDPPDLGNDNIGPNDSFTLVLVRNFTGSVGDDLDDNNDGVLDTADLPWNTSGSVNGVIDGVGFLSYDDSATPAAFNGHTLVAADLSAAYEELKLFQPDNVSRRVGNFDANSAAAWFGGDISVDEPDGLDFSFDVFGISPTRAATPGLPNAAPAEDTDQDGISDAGRSHRGHRPQRPHRLLPPDLRIRDAAGVMLSWSSVPGKTYTLSTPLTCGPIPGSPSPPFRLTEHSPAFKMTTRPA